MVSLKLGSPMTRAAVLATVALTLPGLARGQDSVRPLEPLAPFDTFVGGRWQLGESSHELEWGVGGRSVRLRGYAVLGGEAKLVSEGMWFWHPGEERIKGLFTAIDMAPQFFECTTRFEGKTMVNDLLVYTAGGGPQRYVERWEPIDEDRYRWTLLEITDNGPKETFDGVYIRR